MKLNRDSVMMINKYNGKIWNMQNITNIIFMIDLKGFRELIVDIWWDESEWQEEEFLFCCLLSLFMH